MGSERSSSDQPAKPAQEVSAPPPGSGTVKDLLEQVLQQTAVNSLADPKSNEAVRKALTDVALQHRDRPLDFEPVVVDLVHATLANQFPMYHSAQRDWRAVSIRIARVLWDDPVSQERLRQLWEELSLQP